MNSPFTERPRLDPLTFKAPPAVYRSVVFWSWNAQLSQDRLKDQIHRMKSAGIGGFFMHAREGIKTSYLGTEWFGMIRTCVDEAAKLGMYAWIYDELGWPSGYAGGEVPRKGREYRAKALLMKKERIPDDEEYRLLSSQAMDHGGMAYIYEWTSPMGNPRYENTSYVDLMNPKVTEAFLESTHRKYELQLGSDFGTAVPGVFSDEGCVVMWEPTPGGMLPWTFEFERLFKEAYGYDLVPVIHGLFQPSRTCDWKKIRCDYWRLIVDLLVMHYSKVTYDWCDERGMLFTGHYMAEDHLWKTMRFLGDTMPHYEYMHIPGMDYLGRQIHKSETELCAGGGTVMTAKQVSSVAHQLGKTRTLSELFGGAGQTFDLRKQKWMIDWHLIHGINMFTPHLLPYSMLGNGKRDWPPTIGPQQPWWEHYPLLNDYQARTSYVLTCGRRVAPLIVIHPMESAWESYTPSDISETERLNRQLGDLCLELLDRQLDFDFGNEQLMEKYAAIKGTEWVIGESSYQGVVIPACLRLRDHTVELLKRFMESGGKVWSYEGVQDLVERIPALSGLPIKPFIPDELDAHFRHRLRVEGEMSSHIWAHERLVDDTGIFFLTNLSLKHAVNARIVVPGVRKLMRWDAETGEAVELRAEAASDGTYMDWRFEPGESLLIVGQLPVGAMDQDNAARSAGYMEEPVCVSVEPVSFELEDTEANMLVLDRYQQFDPDAGQWSAPVLTAHLRQRTEKGLQHPLKLRAVVEMGSNPPAMPICLYVEPGMCGSLAWDGVKLSAEASDWLDPELLAYGVPAELLYPGRHVIEFETSTDRCSGIENLLLRGFFEVHLHQGGTSFVISGAGKGGKTADRDLTKAGYPFFSGKMRLKARFTVEQADPVTERRLLRFMNPHVSGLKLWVNSRPAGSKAWGPWEWDISEYVHNGVNEIEAEIVNTLRNTLGPHHTPDDEHLQYLRPASFSDDHESYFFHPFTIGEARLECYSSCNGIDIPHEKRR